MDGRTRYVKIKRLLSPYIGMQLRMSQIERLIMINIGTAPKLISDTARLMIELGLIVEIDHLLFKVVEPQDEGLIASEGIDEKEIVDSSEEILSAISNGQID